jgi:o-succinylbenzoate synthase
MNAERFSLPLAEPVTTARGRIDRREGFLLRVDGGLGEATPLTGWTESLPDCRAALERATEGAAPGESTPAARHGVCLARADARARAADIPLCRHLGEDPRETVAVNATVGDHPPDDTAERVRWAAERGFRTVKLKVGARDLAADIERVRAARDAADVALRADANGAWQSGTARQACDALAGLVEYVEQPTPADDLDALAALREAVAVPLAADEALVAHGPAAVLDQDAADRLVLKPMALGGVGRARSVAEHASAAGVDCVVSTTFDAVVARTAAVHLAATLPETAHGLATADLLAADLGPDPAPVTDGETAVPDGPGLGIDPAEVSV